MVEADFSGNYLNPENAKQNDIGVVLSEGEYQEKKNFKNETYKQLVIDIEVNGKRVQHSPKTLEGKELVKAWGRDTKNWVGKKFSVEVVNIMSMGKPKKICQISPVVEKA